MNLADYHYAVVVAHPDDEIIFASSLIKDASLVVICFSEDSSSRLISKGRLSAQDELPSNYLFLSIPESGVDSCVKFPFSPSSVNNSGFSSDNSVYNDNYSLISSKLEAIIEPYDIVFTHSPWGDYGHYEHIQVFSCVHNLSYKHSFTIFCFGYLSQFSFPLFLSESLARKSRIIVADTNLDIYKSISMVYKKHNCWTWYNTYNPPLLECFYCYSESKKDIKITPQTNIFFINFIPLTFVDKQLVPSTFNLVSHNYFLYFLKVCLLSLAFLFLSSVQLIKRKMFSFL